MEGEVIKEVEKKKTDGFVGKKRKWGKIGEKISKLKPGEALIIPAGTYSDWMEKEK